MLQFIFGKPYAGKTHTVLNKIKELTDMGKGCILIVPEQFTFESEKSVLRLMGDRSALSVGVFSFTRLCDEINRIYGGGAAKILTESEKIIFMKMALLSCKDNLKLWHKYVHSVSFAKTLLDTIGEFKINSITPDDLKNASENTNGTALSSKLYDLSLIYSSFDNVVGEKYIDPADRLSFLYKKLENSDFFKGKIVFFDSFKGFTGQQYKIIERIAEKCEDLYFSFTNDLENSKEYNIYTNIRTTVKKIERICNSRAQKTEENIILKDSCFIEKQMNLLEQLMSGKDILGDKNADSITICKAATPYDEAEFVARNIKKLVRTNGYRYKDFVVISRDSDIYSDSIVNSFKKNDIPLFFDNRIPLSVFPLSRAAEAAIDALKLSTESILRFHKTGLGTLSTDEISTLENYTYLWNIGPKEWLCEWEMDPRGFVPEESHRDTDSLILEEINRLRVKALEPLLEFKDNFNGNAYNMASAIVKLFEKCDCSNKLITLCEQLSGESDYFNEDVLKQSYEQFFMILDGLVNCYGEASITKQDFCESLAVSVSHCDIGVIPQLLDEVTFGSADRIRPSNPKVVFIVGANQGIFPKLTQNSGVFNLAERRILINSGLEIADNSVYSTIDEDFLVYCNVCSASEKLYILYSLNTVTGEELEPSAFVLILKEKLNCNLCAEPLEQITYDNLPEAYNVAFSELCARINDKKTYNLLSDALSKQDDESFFKKINNLKNEEKIMLSKENARQLFGENITMSASKLDSFNRCRFSFFCRYGLGAKRLQPVEFDVMQKGTVVHYVLERFLNEYKDKLDILSKNDTDRLTEKYIAEYLDSIKGYRQIETARLKFLVDRLCRSLKEVVRHITAELKQSDFKPVGCELKIGKNEPLGELKFPYDSGEIDIIGSIDRVDSYNGYIRVIDYKTGSKRFKLPDVLFGLNMQMLLYLYALTRGQNKDDITAAGILYQPSKRDISDKGLAMNGLLQGDSDLVYAMEKENSGEFIPKLNFNKDGSLSKRNSSFINPQEFTDIFDYLEKIMRKTGNLIHSGDIAVSPLNGRESPACAYCDFASVCGIENADAPRVPDMTNQEVLESMKEDTPDGI